MLSAVQNLITGKLLPTETMHSAYQNGMQKVHWCMRIKSRLTVVWHSNKRHRSACAKHLNNNRIKVQQVRSDDYNFFAV